MSDDINLITPALVRAARALLGWSRAELAYRAVLARHTIGRCEAARSRNQIKPQTWRKLKYVFQNHGIDFVVDHRGPIGVALREPQR